MWLGGREGGRRSWHSIAAAVVDAHVLFEPLEAPLHAGGPALICVGLSIDCVMSMIAVLQSTISCRIQTVSHTPLKQINRKDNQNEHKQPHVAYLVITCRTNMLQPTPSIHTHRHPHHGKSTTRKTINRSDLTESLSIIMHKLHHHSTQVFRVVQTQQHSKEVCCNVCCLIGHEIACKTARTTQPCSFKNLSVQVYAKHH